MLRRQIQYCRGSHAVRNANLPGQPKSHTKSLISVPLANDERSHHNSRVMISVNGWIDDGCDALKVQRGAILN
jgi:hypothetical protein